DDLGERIGNSPGYFERPCWAYCSGPGRSVTGPSMAALWTIMGASADDPPLLEVFRMGASPDENDFLITHKPQLTLAAGMASAGCAHRPSTNAATRPRDRIGGLKEIWNWPDIWGRV